MIVFTSCKINIGLNIISRRNDGYHNISTLMVPVNYGDILEIVPSKNGNTTLTTFGRQIDCPVNNNLVMRAYKALSSKIDLPPVDIYLDKVVPDGAGLGGGSADASFTLITLNKLFSLGLSKEELADIASSLGADCPLFIYNRPMLATGTGTTLSPVNIDLSAYHILIVKPDVKIPTHEAYQGVTPHKWATPLESMLTDILSSHPVNDFESSIFNKHPQLSFIKQKMVDLGAIYSSMSGSGSSIYGIYDSYSAACKARDVLSYFGVAHICHSI